MPLSPISAQSGSYASDRAQLMMSVMGKSARDQLSYVEGFCAKYPHDAYANYALATTLVAAGHELSAIPFAQKAVQFGHFQPDHVALLLRIYSEHFYYEQIDALLPHIAASGKTSPELNQALGQYFSRIGQPSTALEYLEKAAAAWPEGPAKSQTRGMIALCLRNVARNEEATTVFKDLAEKPEYRARALSELAQMAKGEEYTTYAQQFIALLEDASNPLRPSDAAILRLQLGNIKEKQGDYDGAFAQWQQARALEAAKYSAAFIERHIKDLKTFFKKDMFERFARYGSQDKTPVFVVGMPRAGTTLMAQILDAHPKAASAGELVRLPIEAYAFVEKYLAPRGLKQLAGDAEQGDFAGRQKDFLSLARLVAGRPADRIIDKTPTQFLSAGYIHLLFPKARFINMTRHPADTFISSYQNEFPANYSFIFSQEGFAHYYLKRREILDYWKTLFPQNILDVSYETLTQSPEEEVRRILDFLGLEWNQQCLKFFERTATVRTFSRDQVRSAVNTKSVGRWRNYEKHLGALFKILDGAGYSYPENI